MKVATADIDHLTPEPVAGLAGCDPKQTGIQVPNILGNISAQWQSRAKVKYDALINCHVHTAAPADLEQPVCTSLNDWLVEPIAYKQAVLLSLLHASKSSTLAALQHVRKAGNMGCTAIIVLTAQQQSSALSLNLLDGMQTIAVYRRGYKLFRAAAVRDTTTQSGIYVLFAASLQAQAAIVKPSSLAQLTMLFQGRAGAHGARILLDTEASSCLISSSFVEQHNLPTSGPHRELTLADGSKSTISGSSTVNVAFGHYRDKKVQCAVMPMSIAYDTILGDPWLKSHHALLSICDDAPTVTLHNGKRKYIIRCGAAVIGQPKDTCSALCSAVQFNNARAQDGSRIFMVLVKQQQGRGDHVAAVGPTPGEGKMTPDLIALHKLLHEYDDILVNDLPGGVPGDRPETGEVTPLQPGSRPVFRRPYRLSPAEKTEVTRTIEELLAKGFIKPSKSPYGSPVLFVAKKDGTLRMCIDYRGLIKQTVSNTYPLPRIDNMLEKLAGAKVFSSIDLASGYHQLRLPESDVPKIAFCTPTGLYEFLVLPFGLTNAPAIFQHKMDEIFRTHADHISVYMDDLLVFSKNHHDHLQHLRSVLSLLHKLYAKPKKCEWLKPELAFLGHIIGAGGIKVDPSKIAVVLGALCAQVTDRVEAVLRPDQLLQEVHSRLCTESFTSASIAEEGRSIHMD